MISLRGIRSYQIGNGLSTKQYQYCVVADKENLLPITLLLTFRMINILPEYADLREKMECHETMEFLFLPPYSPELNPIERVWHRLKYLKRNREFKNINELEAWLEKVFEEARQTYGFLYGIGLTDINVAA